MNRKGAKTPRFAKKGSEPQGRKDAKVRQEGSLNRKGAKTPRFAKKGSEPQGRKDAKVRQEGSLNRKGAKTPRFAERICFAFLGAFVVSTLQSVDHALDALFHQRHVPVEQVAQSAVAEP
jgi:hypothetical protein